MSFPADDAPGDAATEARPRVSLENAASADKQP
jgi:hypothetical protein